MDNAFNDAGVRDKGSTMGSWGCWELLRFGGAWLKQWTPTYPVTCRYFGVTFTSSRALPRSGLCNPTAEHSDGDPANGKQILGPGTACKIRFGISR